MEKGCVVANVIDGADPPGETSKSEDRVEVEGELGSVPTGACEHCHKAIDSSDFVEDLKEN